MFCITSFTFSRLCFFKFVLYLNLTLAYLNFLFSLFSLEINLKADTWQMFATVTMINNNKRLCTQYNIVYKIFLNFL